jgi:hypothetical protein
MSEGFTWNYRILRNEGHDMLIEASYSDGASKPTGWSYASTVSAEEGGMGAELDRMGQALARPILTIADVGEPCVFSESEVMEHVIFELGVDPEDWDRTPDSIKAVLFEMYNLK